jgi:hypothetical protein
MAWRFLRSLSPNLACKRGFGALIGAAGRCRYGQGEEEGVSVVKAVKENARDRVGPVPPERVIPDPKQKAAAKPKHKKTLADLIDTAYEG